MKFESLTHVHHYAAGMNIDVVIYKNKVIDVTDFKQIHPGGVNSLDGFIGKEVTEAFENISSHKTKAAIRDLNTYFIGEIQTDKEGKIIEDEIDQSEKFDLKKGLLWQIWEKGMPLKDYMEFIHDPKHMIDPPSAILFNWTILEMFTKTPAYLIPCIYSPFMIYYFYLACLSLNLIQILIFFAFGILLWTLSEYCLHRFIFHADESIPDNRVSVLLHFLLHGIHHAFPMDGYSLLDNIYH